MLSSLTKALWADKRGATSIEYALVAVLVSIAAMAALTTTGQSLAGIFTTVANSFGTTP